RVVGVVGDDDAVRVGDQARRAEVVEVEVQGGGGLAGGLDGGGHGTVARHVVLLPRPSLRAGGSRGVGAGEFAQQLVVDPAHAPGPGSGSVDGQPFFARGVDELQVVPSLGLVDHHIERVVVVVRAGVGDEIAGGVVGRAVADEVIDG